MDAFEKAKRKYFSGEKLVPGNIEFYLMVLRTEFEDESEAHTFVNLSESPPVFTIILNKKLAGFDNQKDVLTKEFTAHVLKILKDL